MQKVLFVFLCGGYRVRKKAWVDDGCFTETGSNFPSSHVNSIMTGLNRAVRGQASELILAEHGRGM